MDLSFLVLEEGALCNVDSEDDIEDIIDRARDSLSGINDRDAFSEIIAATLPCRIGLVCRRVALSRRECRRRQEGLHFFFERYTVSN